jgi:UDP-N-acetyl-D-glucosamine dehydrogenase
MNPPNTVAIIGFGYVGLPMLLAYARAGFRVIGFDIDESKKLHLLRGESYIKHIPTADVAAALAGAKLDATTDFFRRAGLRGRAASPYSAED